MEPNDPNKKIRHLRLITPPEERETFRLDLNAKTLLNLAEAAKKGHLAGVLMEAICDTWTIDDPEREGWAGPRVGHLEYTPDPGGGPIEVTIKFRYHCPPDVDLAMGSEDEPVSDAVYKVADAFKNWR